MQNTFKLAALALTVSLGIASCGGQTPPDTGSKPNPGPVAEDPDPGTTTPVTGGTIARPADATAANEFIITGERAKALARSLGLGVKLDADRGSVRAVMAAQGIKAQAVEDEMRVLLSVTRAKSGDNAGKKRATATFVWGNGKEKIVPINKDTPAITLDIYPQATPANYKRYEGNLNMEVKYPDFQDKTTRSGPYVLDTGAQCARLTFNFTTAENTASGNAYTPLLFNNSSSPLEVCEGVSERNAEKVALEKYSDGLMYTEGSVGAAPFAFVSKDGVTALPTDAAGLAAVAGTDPAATVTTSTLADFFAPLVVMPAGDSSTWTPDQKAQAAQARKYASLQKQFGYYYRETRVYTVATSAGREDIVLLGLNGWGVGGLKTIRFK